MNNLQHQSQVGKGQSSCCRMINGSSKMDNLLTIVIHRLQLHTLVCTVYIWCSGLMRAQCNCLIILLNACMWNKRGSVEMCYQWIYSILDIIPLLIFLQFESGCLYQVVYIFAYFFFFNKKFCLIQCFREKIDIVIFVSSYHSTVTIAT